MTRKQEVLHGRIKFNDNRKVSGTDDKKDRIPLQMRENE